MATQLNPGADAVLVQAATNAAMANVPKDYSKAFTAMAQGQVLGLAGIQAAVTPLVSVPFATYEKYHILPFCAAVGTCLLKYQKSFKNL